MHRSVLGIDRGVGGKHLYGCSDALRGHMGVGVHIRLLCKRAQVSVASAAGLCTARCIVSAVHSALFTRAVHSALFTRTVHFALFTVHCAVNTCSLHSVCAAACIAGMTGARRALSLVAQPAAFGLLIGDLDREWQRGVLLAASHSTGAVFLPARGGGAAAPSHPPPPGGRGGNTGTRSTPCCILETGRGEGRLLFLRCLHCQ